MMRSKNISNNEIKNRSDLFPGKVQIDLGRRAHRLSRDLATVDSSSGSPVGRLMAARGVKSEARATLAFSSSIKIATVNLLSSTGRAES